MISLENITVTTRSRIQSPKILLQETSLQFDDGKVHAIVGPNGSGKTTLLRILSGLTQPTSGHIAVDKISIAELSALKIASLLSFVESEHQSPFAFTVADTISWGRWQYHQGFPSAQDLKFALASATELNLQLLLDRATNTLSLGERKKTHIAKSLAANTKHIVWDEPLAPLDIRAAIDLIKLAQQKARQGRCVILSIHDLALALNYADTVTVLHHGQVLFHGKNTDPNAIKALESVFRITILPQQTAAETKFQIVLD